MDPQIEELKELVRQNIALTQETNKVVKGMRNAGRVKSVFWVLVLLLSVISSVYAYYYLVLPRITEVKNFYETNILPLQGAGSSILNFLQNSGASGAEAQ